MINTPVEPGQFALVPLADIVSSPTNPRKHFDAAKLSELADTIKASGVHTPILLRYLPPARLQDTFTDRRLGSKLPQYEIVAGERRYRASAIAGVATIPALIRAMSDQQALEVQLLENLQRDDLSELEEAEGYQQLCDLTNIAKDALAEKIGRSRRYVYDRLKLLKLQPLARTALQDGKISATAALAIAVVHDGDLQAKALAHATQTDWQGETPSTRELQRWMRQTLMLELAKAPFDIQLAALYPRAGACTTCPKRTGADPDLFADTPGPDMCLDAPCYRAKEAAHSQIKIAEAQAKGQTIISGKAAQELLVDGYKIKFKGYRRLDDAEDSPTDKPLRKIIGKQMDVEGLQEVMIENPKKAGELIGAITNENALRLIKTVLGNADEAKAVSKEVKQLAAEKKKKADDKALEKFEQAWRDDLVAMTWDDIRSGKGVFSIDVHRYTAIRTAWNLSTGQAAQICRLLDLGAVAPVQAVIEHVRECANPSDIHQLMIMVRDCAADHYRTHVGEKNEGLHLIAGIVFGDALAQVITDLKTECAEKYLQPRASLAQPSTLPKKSKLPADAASPKHKPKKPKLTPEQAQLGIALAMQNTGVIEGADAPTQGSIEGAEAPDSIKEVAAVAAIFTPGQRVKVLGTEVPWWKKHIGKVGKLKAKTATGAWDVTIGGGIAEFDAHQLQAVPA